MPDVVLIVVIVIVVVVALFFCGFFVYVRYAYRAVAEQQTIRQNITTHAEIDDMNFPLQLIVQSNLPDLEDTASSAPPPKYNVNPTAGEIVVVGSPPRRAPRIGQRIVRAESEDNGIWTII